MNKGFIVRYSSIAKLEQKLSAPPKKKKKKIMFIRFFYNYVECSCILVSYLCSNLKHVVVMYKL